MENLSLVGCKSLTENEKQETNGGIAPIGCWCRSL